MSKASLETLARTMSIAFLSLAVVAIGTEQVTKAEALEPTQALYTNGKVPKVKLNKLKAVVVGKNPTQAHAKPASQRKAPKSYKARALWVKQVLKEAGFKGENLREAWAIVMKESSGHPNSHNTNYATGDNSYGLFQINMIGSLGPDRREIFDINSNSELFDPLTNAESAYHMSQGGKDWSSWDIDSSGYNGGTSKDEFQYWYSKYPKGN